jgi:hypothetical protein
MPFIFVVSFENSHHQPEENHLIVIWFPGFFLVFFF